MNVDYIIVGLGLAGLSFAEQLLQNDKSFVVFEDDSQKSSLVAGGTYNPVILKRFTPVWNADEQLDFAMFFYKQLSDKLGEEFDTKFVTRKLFSSVGDENNWFMAADKPMLSKYMNPKVNKETIDGVITDFGYGELSGTGWINTSKLLTSYKKYLEDIQCLKSESFVYADIKFKDGKVIYNNITAKCVVFCEGFGLKKNPFFNHLPLNGTKGETMVIHAPDLKIDCQLKSAVFVFPLGGDLYKVGATFNWTDKTSMPTEEGKAELEQKLKKVITVPYSVVSQSAGIRPTVKDRRPLVGVHTEYNQLAVLNGLGTRGVMIGPTVAKNLYSHLEKNQELDKEININRFN